MVAKQQELCVVVRGANDDKNRKSSVGSHLREVSVQKIKECEGGALTGCVYSKETQLKTLNGTSILLGQNHFSATYQQSLIFSATIIHRINSVTTLMTRYSFQLRNQQQRKISK